MQKFLYKTILPFLLRTMIFSTILLHMSIFSESKHPVGYLHNVLHDSLAPHTPLCCSEAALTATVPSETSNSHILDDPSLKSTWSHRAWLATGCAIVLISLAKSITASAASHIWLKAMLAGCAGYILADLASGVYHWGIDNYGDASTPIFGAQIDAFRRHHKQPSTITRRQFANLLHPIPRAVTLIVLPMVLLFHDPVVHAFVALCSASIIFIQQFHAWAHGAKSRLPPLVVALQEAGVLVSQSQHADHHQPPYNSNYCIVSGVWNKVLDDYKVFEVLEMMLFSKLGMTPRSTE